MDSEGLQGHCLAMRSSITDFLLKCRCQDEAASHYLFKLLSTVGCQYPTLKSIQEAFVTFHCSISTRMCCQVWPTPCKKVLSAKNPEQADTYGAIQRRHLYYSLTGHHTSLHSCFKGYSAVGLEAMFGLVFFW